MNRCLLFLLAFAMLSACGGGGGGGSSDSTPQPTPPPNEPTPEPTELSLLDAIPNQAAPNVDPLHNTATMAYLGHSDLTISVSSDCENVTSSTLRRTIFDLASQDFDELIEHKYRCEPGSMSTLTTTAEGTRANDAAFQATHSFSTGTQSADRITVLQEFSRPRDIVNDMFTGYVSGALLSELELPSGFEALVLGAIVDLAEANWSNLVDPESLYDVTSQQVSYLSRTPSGAPSSQLTAAITFPDLATAVGFTPRDKIIVLTHATGSTPGDLDPADAWYILASQFASRGYLVIAPDNYGRGGTESDPETYLMTNRTAFNSIDLIRQVLADTSYDAVYSGQDITIVGYSQGGHSAMGLWQSLAVQHPDDVTVREVYAGGAPHNLYQTVRGVLQFLDGSCDDGPYCRNVDEDTTVPFATDRILPAFLNYTETGLSLNDIVSGSTIDSTFVSGFLGNEAEYDAIKTILQLNSFTNVVNAVDNFSGSQTLVHLYHSQFDRLVPIENTEELAGILSPHLAVDFHQNRCNADGYEVIFNLTGKVGALHTLCGLAVLDDAMEDLR